MSDDEMVTISAEDEAPMKISEPSNDLVCPGGATAEYNEQTGELVIKMGELTIAIYHCVSRDHAVKVVSKF